MAQAFSNLYSAIFGIQVETLSKAGKLKAEATREHDLAEDPETPKDEVGLHWEKAEQLLIGFYTELDTVLNTYH